MKEHRHVAMYVRISEPVYLALKKESSHQRLSMSRLVEHFVSEGCSKKYKNVIKRVIGL